MDNSGNIRNKKTGRLLKIQLSNSGYYICRLCKNGRCKTVTINSLKCKDTIQSLEGFIVEQLFLEFNSRITKTYLENNWNYIIYGRDNIYLDLRNSYEKTEASREYRG